MYHVNDDELETSHFPVWRPTREHFKKIEGLYSARFEEAKRI